MDAVQLKILIVDDDESLRITTAASLAQYETHVAESASVAQFLMAQTDFDVVVCDLVMPRMTGAELYASLAADSPLRDRFLFMTGGGLPVAIQSFLALTGVPVLRKPFRVHELREAVATVAAVVGV